MEDLPYVFFGSDDDDWNKDEEGESTQILQLGNDSTYVCTYTEKNSDTKFSTAGFFMNPFPPSPSIPSGQFKFFSKICRDIRSSRCTSGSGSTPVDSSGK
jgi:hypothetical protein